MAFFIPFLFIHCISALLLVGGLLLAIVGFWALWRELAISKHGLIVPGTVIAVDTRRERANRGGGKVTVHVATVRFQKLESNDSTTFLVDTRSFRIYHIDQPVRVIYVPSEQESIRIDGRFRWLAPWGFICFGFVFMTLTIIMSVPQAMMSY